MPLFYVYAYDMAKCWDGTWSQLCWTRIISYHEDVREASWEVTRLINEDETDMNECFAIGSIPLCNDEHNLA